MPKSLSRVILHTIVFSMTMKRAFSADTYSAQRTQAVGLGWYEPNLWFGYEQSVNTKGFSSRPLSNFDMRPGVRAASDL